jgi:truncated hemoglobin YjbI
MAVGRRGKVLDRRAAESDRFRFSQRYRLKEMMMSSESLYDRLGGEAKIRQIVTDLLALHKQNPAIATRYHNAKKSDAEIIGLVVDLLGSATGGTQKYTGMDMTTAHKGMNCWRHSRKMKLANSRRPRSWRSTTPSWTRSSTSRLLASSRRWLSPSP